MKKNVAYSSVFFKCWVGPMMYKINTDDKNAPIHKSRRPNESQIIKKKTCLFGVGHIGQILSGKARWYGES